MPTNMFESKDFELRLYDGTAVTPNYVQGIFLNDDFPEFSVTGGAQRPPQILILDREQANAEMAYVAGSDRDIFAPIEGSATFLFNASAIEYIRAWGNPQLVEPWEIGGVTFQPVTNIGTRQNGRNVAVPCAIPSDVRANYLVNAYFKAVAPASGGTDYVQEMLGLSPNPETLQFAVDGAMLRVTLSYLIFGGIDQIADFPTGTPVVPA